MNCKEVIRKSFIILETMMYASAWQSWILMFLKWIKHLRLKKHLHGWSAVFSKLWAIHVLLLYQLRRNVKRRVSMHIPLLHVTISGLKCYLHVCVSRQKYFEKQIDYALHRTQLINVWSFLIKYITQWWTLVELCHGIKTVTAIQVVRPCSTDHFS